MIHGARGRYGASTTAEFRCTNPDCPGAERLGVGGYGTVWAAATLPATRRDPLCLRNEQDAYCPDCGEEGEPN